MDSSAKACAQVRRAGEDVTQMFIPHELPAFLLNQPLHLSRQTDNQKHAIIRMAENRMSFRPAQILFIYTSSQNAIFLC